MRRIGNGEDSGSVLTRNVYIKKKDSFEVPQNVDCFVKKYCAFFLFFQNRILYQSVVSFRTLLLLVHSLVVVAYAALFRGHFLNEICAARSFSGIR